MCFMLQESAMNGRHLWMDTDTSGNSCYLTECESLVGIDNYYCLQVVNIF